MCGKALASCGGLLSLAVGGGVRHLSIVTGQMSKMDCVGYFKLRRVYTGGRSLKELGVFQTIMTEAKVKGHGLLESSECPTGSSTLSAHASWENHGTQSRIYCRVRRRPRLTFGCPLVLVLRGGSARPDKQHEIPLLGGHDGLFWWGVCSILLRHNI